MTEREQLIEDAREFWMTYEGSSMFEMIVDFAVKVRDEVKTVSTITLGHYQKVD